MIKKIIIVLLLLALVPFIGLKIIGHNNPGAADDLLNSMGSSKSRS